MMLNETITPPSVQLSGTVLPFAHCMAELLFRCDGLFNMMGISVFCCVVLCCAEGAVTKGQKAGMSTHGYR